MSRTHAAAALALLIAAAVGLSRQGSAGHAATPPPTVAARPSPASIAIEPAAAAPVLVHVAGAVRKPGLYRLHDGDRVDDAVRRAGGATARADLDTVNLAAKVQDGRQVLVPERPPRIARAGTAAAATGPAPAGGSSAAPAPGSPPSGPVDLNAATLEQLDGLPGIGPATAQKILDYRDVHNGFGTVDELGQISGIGEKRMATLRAAVTV
jgi:competence protein ComEA